MNYRYSFLLLAVLAVLGACNSGGGGATGTLQINITGLPDGVNANVVVTKPDSTTQNVTASGPINNAPVGSYTVLANPVSSGSSTFNATVSGSPATVSAGGTATVSVSYAVAVAGCPNPAVFDNPACTFDTATFGP